MTGRILQEDTSLLLTEANEPLQNDNFIGATGFATGSPVLGTSSIAQTHNILGVSVTTSQPSISTVGLTQEHSLASNSFTSGNPSISTVALTQQHGLTPNSLLT